MTLKEKFARARHPLLFLALLIPALAGTTRFLRLPVISQPEPDGQRNLETVAVIWTPAVIMDQNGHSRFEAH